MAYFRVWFGGTDKIRRAVPDAAAIQRDIRKALASYGKNRALPIIRSATPVLTGKLRRGWRAEVPPRDVRGRFAAARSLRNPTEYARYVFQRNARRTRSPKERANLRRHEAAVRRIQAGSERVVEQMAERATRKHTLT